MDAWSAFDHDPQTPSGSLCPSCGLSQDDFLALGPIRCGDMKLAVLEGPSRALRTASLSERQHDVMRRASAKTWRWLTQGARDLKPGNPSVSVVWGPEMTLAQAEQLWGYHPRPLAGAGPQVSIGGAGTSPPTRVPGAAYRGPITFHNGIAVEWERHEIEELLAEVDRLRHLLASERGARAVRLSATWEHLPCVTAGATVRREHHPVIRAIAIGSRPPDR